MFEQNHGNSSLGLKTKKMRERFDVFRVVNSKTKKLR